MNNTDPFAHYQKEDPLGACRAAMKVYLGFAFVVVVIVIVALLGWKLGF